MMGMKVYIMVIAALLCVASAMAVGTADSPDVYYTFDNVLVTDTGITIFDEQGNTNAFGYNDTFVNWSITSYLVNSSKGQAFRTDSDRIVRESNHDLTNADGWTMSVIVNLDDLVAPVIAVTDTVGGDGPYGLMYWDFIGSSGTNIRLGLADFEYSHGVEATFNTGGVTTGVDYMITVVYTPQNNDASDIRMYINGTNLSLSSDGSYGSFNSSMINWSQVDITFGGAVDFYSSQTINAPLANDTFPAYIDNIKLFNEPLNQSEVTALLAIEQYVPPPAEEEQVATTTQGVNAFVVLLGIAFIVLIGVELGNKFGVFKGVKIGEYTPEQVMIAVLFIIAILIIITYGLMAIV
jgi:hypothetical protein